MKLTAQQKYAVKLVLYVLEKGQVRVEDVATNLDLSRSLLEQVARKLRLADILEAVRGPGGGYHMKSASIPSIGDVVMSNAKPLQKPRTTLNVLETLIAKTSEELMKQPLTSLAPNLKIVSVHCNYCELTHVECICGSVSAFFEICKDLPRAAPVMVKSDADDTQIQLSAIHQGVAS